MDDNTLKLWVEIFKLIGVFIALVVAPVVTLIVTLRTHKKITTIDVKVDETKVKLEETKSLVNGHMEELLRTTKELGASQEKARAEQDKPKKH